jgi:hypothetical protein
MKRFGNIARQQPEWVADTNPSYHPPVYRKGVLAYQLHPGVLFTTATLWLLIGAWCLGLMPQNGEPRSDLWMTAIWFAEILGGLLSFGTVLTALPLLWRSPTAHFELVGCAATLGFVILTYCLKT